MIREIIVWGDHFYSLYNQLDIKVKKKIDYVFWLIRYTEKVPIRFLKYLEDTDGLYELKSVQLLKKYEYYAFSMNQNWLW